jgi:hypothetical protein
MRNCVLSVGLPVYLGSRIALSATLELLLACASFDPASSFFPSSSSSPRLFCGLITIQAGLSQAFLKSCFFLWQSMLLLGLTPSF